MFLHIKTYNGVLQNTYLNCLSPEFNMNHAQTLSPTTHISFKCQQTCVPMYITLTQMKLILAVI